VVIIPVRVENVAPNDSLAYQFATRQWVNLFEDWEREIERLGIWISRIVNSDPAGAALPAQPPAPACAAKPLPTAMLPDPAASAAPSASSNPLHHFVGALLLVVAAFLVVFAAPKPLAPQDPWAAFTSGEAYHPECADPFSPRSFSAGECETSWQAVAAFFATAVALLIASIGTIRHQLWARYLGGGLCAAGVALGGYIAVWHAHRAYVLFAHGFNVDDFLKNAIKTPFAPTATLFIAIISGLFVIVFAVAASIYIWKWRADSEVASSEHRVTNFTLAVGLLCASAVALLYAYQVTLNSEGWLWVGVLAALEALVFAFCFICFRREFG
jgi:hypothetical protein